MGRSVRILRLTVAILLGVCLSSFAALLAESAPSAKAAISAKQLEQLCRILKKNSTTAYASLSALAGQKSSGASGARAALALGYYDYSKGNYQQAAKWLERAKSDALLRDYALYWDAETKRGLDRDAEALADLEQLRKDFPDSVMSSDALESLAEAALAANRPADALAALDSDPATPLSPALLLLRGEASEQAGDLFSAANDYRAVYLRFPASSQASQAGLKFDFLRGRLGDQLPPVPVDQRFSRAGALYAARLWSEARTEYEQILPQLSGAERELAGLRILECAALFGAGPSDLVTLQISDPEVDAERFASLADVYRALAQDASLVQAVESAVARAPSSQPSEAALFLAGNYYWVDLDRDRAAGFYKRVADNFPKSPDAVKAHWRVAWTALLKRDPQAAESLAEHLRRFPGSPFTPDALYWLGRLAEEDGKPSLARAFYEKLHERYPQNYFETQAAARLHVLGNGDSDDPDVLATIPPLPPVQPLGAIPSSAANRQARADALRSIAFDSSAELELRAAYAATGEPRFLLEAAEAANEAGHCGVAFAIIRQIYPQLESRLFGDVPREVWLAAYPLPFKSSVRQWSAQAGVDPMLVAGLIRQESAFEPEARSVASALGLMQLLPKTGRLMARQAKIPYSHNDLLTPDYNVRLGTLYLADLRKQFGSVESALAAYNAGEDRILQWTAGQEYRELPEFVDSIPFTETREYVEIVTRNAGIYRKLYGTPQNEPAKTRARSGH